MERLAAKEGIAPNLLLPSKIRPGELKGRSEGSFTDHTTGYLKKWIEIVNGVRYIIFLEYGYSKQAPAGMVRVSMRELTGQKSPTKLLGKQWKKDWNKFHM